MMSHNPQKKIELLQAEAEENDQSFFRLLVDGRAIKYITIEPGLYSVEDMCFGPSLVSLLPELPPGDWNDGLVAREGGNGAPRFTRTARTAFASVRNTWHNTFVDYLEIVVGRKLRTGVYEVSCPLFNKVVVAKFARFDWEVQYMENETTAYQWIGGYDIGPRFLGHLTEEGRVIGFLMKRIPAERHAGPQDLESCQEALSRLHDLGIQHGDINRFNFLICQSKAVLVDFDTAQKCDNLDLLLEELEDLPLRLNDPSNRGGGGAL
jgi:predicted Ser/Thr protein kinase